MQTYPTKQNKELIKAFSHLNGEKEFTGFLRDLLTPTEIEEEADKAGIDSVAVSYGFHDGDLLSKSPKPVPIIDRIEELVGLLRPNRKL